MANVVDEINTVVGQLSPDRQKRVLEYAQSLAQPDQLQIPGLLNSLLNSGNLKRRLL